MANQLIDEERENATKIEFAAEVTQSRSGYCFRKDDRRRKADVKRVSEWTETETVHVHRRDMLSLCACRWKIQQI